LQPFLQKGQVIFLRNPNGYGTVAKLSGSRRRPYIVKKVSGWKENGQPQYSIIGYAATREEGNLLLAEYNRNPWDVDRAKITLWQLFELWQEKKMPKLGVSNQKSLCSAFGHCSALKDLPYKQIKAYQMQDCIDGCGRSYSTQGAIKNLWGHLDRFALELDIINRRYSDLLTSDPVPPTTRGRFADDEIQALWACQGEPWADSALILIYSGWRISELLDLRKTAVDLEAGTMTGGAKTKAGKGRVVPIHSAIRPIVERFMAQPGPYLIGGQKCPQAAYRKAWSALTARLRIRRVPHECRHTFESLLDSAGANRRYIDLMMGHVSKDTGNRVYNHKTLEELKSAIELIKPPCSTLNK
jgi:hypothetical protein